MVGGDTMMTIHEPKSGNRRQAAFRALSFQCQARLRRTLWRCANILFAAAGVLLKYHVIGPIGGRRIWKSAEFFEHLAERIWHNPR